ncbi:unnamed protein product [Gordionus sp. m RMFG-2023]
MSIKVDDTNIRENIKIKETLIINSKCENNYCDDYKDNEMSIKVDDTNIRENINIKETLIINSKCENNYCDDYKDNEMSTNENFQYNDFNNYEILNKENSDDTNITSNTNEIDEISIWKTLNKIESTIYSKKSNCRN